MLLHAGGNSQDVEIKNDVFGREIQLLSEQPINAFGNGHFIVDGCRLPFFVESHHHRRGAVPAAQGRLAQEFLLAALKADGVYDTFALQAFKALLQHRPFGAVHHDGDARDVRIRSEQIEEFAHALLGIEQAFVKTNIDDIGAVLHLLPRQCERRLKIAFLDEFLEFRRTHDVGALTDHRKLPGAIAYILRFQAAQTQRGWAPFRQARLHLSQRFNDRL